jgi:hypothetical protein
VCRGSGRQWVGGQIPRFTVDVARIDADAGRDQEHHKCPMYLSSLDDGVRGIYSERCSGDMRFMIVLGESPTVATHREFRASYWPALSDVEWNQHVSEWLD